MKIPAILLVLLLFAVDAAAQTPAGSVGPLQIAQGGTSAPAGSAAVGATLPAAHTSGSSATVAAIAFTVAGFAAAAFGSYGNNTASNH